MNNVLRDRILSVLKDAEYALNLIPKHKLTDGRTSYQIASIVSSLKNDLEYTVGDTRKASEINGRNMQLFTKREDIKWVYETHIKNPNANHLKVKGVIMIGNEDAPDEIWGTCKRPANHMDTEYMMIYKPGVEDRG